MDLSVPMANTTLLSIDPWHHTDNASNNDMMVSFLSTIIDDFPGAVNHTHCFAHMVNIVAKAILKQFDVPKASAGDSGTVDDDSTIQGLSEDLGAEDQSTLEAWKLLMMRRRKTNPWTPGTITMKACQKKSSSNLTSIHSLSDPCW